MDKTLHQYIVPENKQSTYAFIIDDHTSAAQCHFSFCVERNALLCVELLIVHTSAQVIIECVLQGEGAQAHIAGVYVLDASNKVHIETVQHHKAARTQSALVMKGIVRDNAYAQYQGIIRVEKEALYSVSSQENKNILLSNNARAVSIPSLQVLNNDVQCSHGSATSRCDEEQLFYCATRGIDEKTAQQLLLQAFVADMFVSDELRMQMHRLIG